MERVEVPPNEVLVSQSSCACGCGSTGDRGRVCCFDVGRGSLSLFRKEKETGGVDVESCCSPGRLCATAAARPAWWYDTRSRWCLACIRRVERVAGRAWIPRRRPYGSWSPLGRLLRLGQYSCSSPSTRAYLSLHTLFPRGAARQPSRRHFVVGAGALQTTGAA